MKKRTFVFISQVFLIQSSVYLDNYKFWILRYVFKVPRNDGSETLLGYWWNVGIEWLKIFSIGLAMSNYATRNVKWIHWIVVEPTRKTRDHDACEWVRKLWTLMHVIYCNSLTWMKTLKKTDSNIFKKTVNCKNYYWITFFWASMFFDQ